MEGEFSALAEMVARNLAKRGNCAQPTASKYLIGLRFFTAGEGCVIDV